MGVNMSEKVSKRPVGPAPESSSEIRPSGEGVRDAGVRRGRPGRRSTEERTVAVLELLSGKATVDQLAFRFGVQASTVQRWREVALEAVEVSLRQGSSKTPEELELAKKLRSLEKAFTDLAIRHEIAQKALAMRRPSRPGKRSK
jgi:transposase-like protein